MSISFNTYYFLLCIAIALFFSLSATAGEIEIVNEASPEHELEPEVEDKDEPPPKGNFDIPEEEQVLVITRDNFQDTISNNDVFLLEFYAPWCGHCQAFSPGYAKAAKELKTHGILIGKIDATLEEDLAKEFSITGYPTILLFKNSKMVETYNGPRSAEGVVSYMTERADPAWQPPPPFVITLTKQNFSDTVNKHPLMLVEFYAPWCGHCKKLEPQLELAAKNLKEDNIILSKVDGTAEAELASTYKVDGYPTLKIFRHGRVFEYNGGRDEHGITTQMRQEALPASQETMRPQETLNHMSQSQSSVMGFFSDKHAFYEEYLAASNDLRGKLILLHTFESSVALKLEVQMDSIVIFRPKIYRSAYEEDRNVFNNISGSNEEILAFIHNHSVPLVGHRTKEMEYWYSKRPLVVVYYDVNFSHDYVKATQIVRHKVLEVAVKFPQLLFAISKEEDFENELTELGLDDSGEEVNVGFWDVKKKYRMEPVDDFSAQDLLNFVSQVKAGKIDPHLKSQAVPRKQPGPVRVVVAKTFEKEVMSADKDVLLEFYAPWCGHCKKLEPVYKKVAKKLAKEDVIVAKMDAISNDIPEQFTVTGFPTIVFIPATDKSNHITYESNDRTLKDLVEFVQKKRTLRLSKEEQQGEEGTEASDHKDEL